MSTSLFSHKKVMRKMKFDIKINFFKIKGTDCLITKKDKELK